jgi:hypothetical protein
MGLLSLIRNRPCPSTASTTRPATTSASSSTPRRTSSPEMSSSSKTGERALVTARVKTDGGPLAALLEVVVAPLQVKADDLLP